jgi:hypothetical protein
LIKTFTSKLLQEATYAEHCCSGGERSCAGKPLRSHLEAALVVSRGLVDAICQLSETDEHSQRRLGAVHAVSGPLLDELRAAGNAVMGLYALHFEDERAGKTDAPATNSDC